MSSIKLLALALMISLSGCATIADLQSKVEAKPDCCKSPAEFTYIPLAAEGLTAVSLRDQSPTFSFSTGKSYFVAYALPQSAIHRRLLVRSFITGSSAVESNTYSQVFCPQVTFLDNRYQQLTSIEKRPLVARGRWSKGIFPSFLSDFDVPPFATYAVLHTNPSNYGQLNMRYAGDGDTIYHPCGPVADAEISFLPAAQPAAREK